MFARLNSLVFLAASMLTAVCAAQDRPVDTVTQQLFEQYVARQAKIDTESVMAATHLVAVRGRETGFWKVVLAELKRGDDRSEIGCVRVLGKMLAVDAAARDAIKRQKETGEVSAWIPNVCLGSEVVTELIERGKKADRFRVDHYAVALVRARVPEAKDFFESLLHANRATPPAAAGAGPRADTAPQGPHHLDGTRFHAAVGLAQLGDIEGIDWLIANSQYNEGTVMNAAPQGTRAGGSLSACCLQALRQLSGDRVRTSTAEWEEWAQAVEKKSARIHAVVFSDP